MAQSKLLLLLAARDGLEGALAEALDREAAGAAALLNGNAQVATLRRLAPDPLARFQPPMRVFDAALELVASSTAVDLASAVSGAAERFEAFVHTDLCAALEGAVNTVVPAHATPYRYVYVMRRKAGMSHAEYLEYYSTIHAEFGRRTPATEGYEQLHLDEVRSESAARTTGLGPWRADSVSELALPSVEGFLAALATSAVATEGPADELNFVDRPNSVGLCAEVTSRRVG